MEDLFVFRVVSRKFRSVQEVQDVRDTQEVSEEFKRVSGSSAGFFFRWYHEYSRIRSVAGIADGVLQIFLMGSEGWRFLVIQGVRRVNGDFKMLWWFRKSLTNFQGTSGGLDSISGALKGSETVSGAFYGVSH